MRRDDAESAIARLELPPIVLTDITVALQDDGETVRFDLTMGDEGFHVHGFEPLPANVADLPLAIFRRLERLARHELSEQFRFNGAAIVQPHPPIPEPPYSGDDAGMRGDGRPFIPDP